MRLWLETVWSTNLITRSISKLLSPKDTALFRSIYSFCLLKFKFICYQFKLHLELFNLSVNWNRLIFCFLIAVIELVVLCLSKRCVSLCTDRWACNRSTEVKQQHYCSWYSLILSTPAFRTSVSSVELIYLIWNAGTCLHLRVCCMSMHISVQYLFLAWMMFCLLLPSPSCVVLTLIFTVETILQPVDFNE